MDKNLEYFLKKILSTNPITTVQIILFRLKLFYKWFFAYYIIKDFGVIERSRWYKDNGDKNFRLNYLLNKNSIVFDIGGYQGDFANSIYEKFNSIIFLFEPNLDYYNKCVERFKRNKKIYCFNYGLSSKNGNFFLSNTKEASSIIKNKKTVDGQTVKIRDFFQVFNELEVKKIDLMKINIEGSEFDLIPHIIKKNLLKKINNIQIQFHHSVLNAKKKRNIIIKDLKKTHIRNWCYWFVWESWSLK
jgi:FkbM family methyltransferase